MGQQQPTYSDPTGSVQRSIGSQEHHTNSLSATMYHPYHTEKLCSATQIDQRFAVEFTVADRSVTTLSVRFDFAGKGAWGMATWALISGTCDSSCSNCSYSSDPTQCIGCNAFFITGSDNKCSQCYPGFALSLLSSVQVCLKCPIEFQNCNPGQQVCYYSSLAGQLNSTDCTFTDTSGTCLSTQTTPAPMMSTP